MHTALLWVPLKMGHTLEFRMKLYIGFIACNSQVVFEKGKRKETKLQTILRSNT
jgi:hypothetical protein